MRLLCDFLLESMQRFAAPITFGVEKTGLDSTNACYRNFQI